MVALEELNCYGCRSLNRLPNLRKLRNLLKLDISGCPLIIKVPGLGDLVALETLHARKGIYIDNASYSFKLPNMHKLSNLRVLRLHECRLKAAAVPGFDSLIFLQEVEANFREVVDRPSLGQLTNLQILKIHGWSSGGLRELDNLAMLHTLEIHYCSGVDERPDFRSLISLLALWICECEFKDFSGLSNLSALEWLWISAGCNKLERFPDFQKLTRLGSLTIICLGMPRGWDRTLGQVEVSSCRLDDTSIGFDLPDSQRLINLRYLELGLSLEDVTRIGAFSQLESLGCSHLAARELPDLSNFPRLETLQIRFCDSLERLTITEPVRALSELELRNCYSLTTRPDLSHFPGLVKLVLTGCAAVSLTALQLLDLDDCSPLEALPDLEMFPALEKFLLKGCSQLTTLSCNTPLFALQELDLNHCSGLLALPDLEMFPALDKLLLKGCSGLTTLGRSVRLPPLKVLDASGCRSLCRDDHNRLRASCPHALGRDVEMTWMLRAVCAGGMIVALGWIFRTFRRSRALEH